MAKSKKGAAKAAPAVEQDGKATGEVAEVAEVESAAAGKEATSVSALLSSLWSAASTTAPEGPPTGKKLKTGKIPKGAGEIKGTATKNKKDDDDDDDDDGESAPLSETFSRLFANSQQPKPKLVVGKTIKAKEKTTGEEAKEGPKATSEKNAKKKMKPKLTPMEREEQEERTLFVGNVPLDWDEKTLRRKLRELVGEQYTGTFKPIRFRSVPVKDKWQFKMRKIGSNIKDFAEDSADSKSAYVVLNARDAVDVVRLATHGIRADERHILRADAVGQSSKLQTFDRKRSVCVGNLPPNVTEADLREAFEEAGEIHAVRIVRDKVTQKCRGVAFILFRERAHVKTALTYHNSFACKRWIRVSRVEVREESDKPANLDEKHPAERRHEGKYPWSPDYKKESESKEGEIGEDKSASGAGKGQGKGKDMVKGKGKGKGDGKGKGNGKGKGLGAKGEGRKGERKEKGKGKDKGKGKGKDKGKGKIDKGRHRDRVEVFKGKGEKRKGDSGQGTVAKKHKKSEL